MNIDLNPSRIPDPLALAKLLWPHVYFYSKQREIIYSFLENDETIVPAGNMLGKDFVAGFLCLFFFLTRTPCRIITTSAKEDHLRVLWGEINTFINTSAYPLTVDQGGPLQVNHHDIRRVVKGIKCPKSYLKGLVASPDSMAAMQGHHIAKTGDGIPRTAFICDESSSVDDDYWKMADTWCNRALIFGNPWPCENFFFRKSEEGDKLRKRGTGYRTKVIPISAYDSPNVRYAQAEQEAGKPISNRIIVPGVKSWDELEKNLETWDPLQISVSVHGKFYKGSELMLYPLDWLEHSHKLDVNLRNKFLKRHGKCIACDPAEGGDNTTIAVGDELGLLELVSLSTPDTSKILVEYKALAIRWNVPEENWLFDAGGGGKQLTDQLRSEGYEVPEAIAFGAAPSMPLKRHNSIYDEKLEVREDRGAYVNVRAELFGTLSEKLNPNNGPGWAIARGYKELIRQLSKMPKLYDKEGRLRMLPKNKTNPNSKEKTLRDLLGCSPDEADAVSLCCWGVFRESHTAVANAE